MAFLVLFAVVAAIAIPIAIAIERGSREKRRVLLEQVAHRVGGGELSDTTGVDATHLGVLVSLRFGHRGTGKSQQQWTFVHAALPPGYPLSLHLRRHAWYDDGQIARGELVDVVIGDALFDSAFVVEAAPADVVRGLLGYEARAFLLGIDRVDVGTHGGRLVLAVAEWSDDVDALVGKMTFVARLVGGVRDVSAALDDQVPRGSGGAVYREIPDDRPVEEARAAREAEVARLEQQRASRSSHGALVVVVLCVLGFAILAVTCG